LSLAPLLRQPVAAQALDPTFTPPAGLYASGQVYTMSAQQTDGKRVVAGSFSRVNGVAASNLARLDATGAADVAFGQNVGNAGIINTLRLLPNGQYLLGSSGNVTAGGLNRPSLLRLNANGTADATFNAGTGTGSTTSFSYEEGFAVQPDGKIVVVGEFDSFNGQPAAGVVRLNADGSVDTGFSVGAGVVPVTTTTYNYVDAVTVQPDGKLLVSGVFATFNGQPANGLVRLNPNGSLDTSFTSPFNTDSEATNVVLQPDGKLLVTGSLLLGNASPGIVRLNTNGSVDTGFTTSTLPGYSTFNLNDPPVAVQPDGKILVVGSFVLANSTRVARLNADGTLDNSFQVTPGSSTSPFTLGLQADGSVLVGGSISTTAGAELPLARLTTTGAVDPAFAPKLQIPGYVNAVVRQANGQLVIGGNFTELNGQPAQRLARLSATGVLDASFTAAVGVQASMVNCLALQADGKLLVGSNGLRRLTTTGSPDASFTYFSSGGTVTALAVQPDGRVLVGGAVSSSTYRYLFRVTTTGAYDASFVRDVNSSTLGMPNTVGAILVQPDGRIVVAEDFAVANTASFYTSRVVRYESTGTLDATFNNLSEFGTTTTTIPDQHRLYSLLLQPDGKILVGGNFGSVNGTTQAGVARLTTTGTLDGSFAPSLPTTAYAYSLALQPNGRVLVGGVFTTAQGSYLTRLLATGQADNSFAPTANPNSLVRSLLVQPDGGIVLGGSFTTVGSQPAFGLARITAPNVLAVAAPAAVAARTQAWPVPAHSVLHVAPDAGAQPRTLELLDGRGRTVRTLPLTSAAETALSVEGLPAGLYLLRVGYATGTVTRAIAVE